MDKSPHSIDFRRTRCHCDIVIEGTRASAFGGVRSPGGEPVGRYLVISSDCHAGPPADLYRSYMDPEYRDQYDAFLASLADMRPELSLAEIRFREKFLA